MHSFFIHYAFVVYSSHIHYSVVMHSLFIHYYAFNIHSLFIRYSRIVFHCGFFLDCAKLLEEFGAERICTNAQSTEVGSCAWSPDGHYFAWGCGYRIVKVVDWIQYKNWK